MESIKVSTNLPKEKVNDIILSYPFNNNVNVHCDSYENREIYHFKINKRMLEDIVLYNNIANLVQKIINNVYMRDLIHQKIEKLLDDYSERDLFSIESTVYDLLVDDNYFTHDKELINDELRDYLIENNSIIIDGYLRFRAKSFEKLIDKIINQVIIDIQIENEYEEFIYMLQYYLDSQVPKYNIVNVIIQDNEFILTDSNNKPIENPTINSIVKEFGMDEISKADILVTSLIVLAPNKVIVHMKNDKEKEVIMILKKLFTNRLTFCYSCNLCDVNMVGKDNE